MISQNCANKFHSSIVCYCRKFVLPLEIKKDNHSRLKRPHFKTNPIKYIGFFCYRIQCLLFNVNNPVRKIVIPFILRSFFSLHHVLIILKTGILAQVWLIALPWQQTYNHVTTPLSLLSPYHFLLLYFLYTYFCYILLKLHYHNEGIWYREDSRNDRKLDGGSYRIPQCCTTVN